MLKWLTLVVGAAIASAVFAQTGTAPGNLLLAAQESPWEFRDAARRRFGSVRN
jgi:hypothetical protein